MFESLTNFILDLVDRFSYFGIFLTMFIESGVFPPIPSDVVLGSVGLLVYQGKINFYLAVLAAALGNMCGTIFLYMVGNKGGRPFIKRYGNYLFIDEEKIKRGELWFGKYGDVVIFVSQFIPLGRSAISVPAGMLGKSLPKVCLLSFAGSLIWSSFFIYVTSKLGYEWEKFVEASGKYENVVLLIALLVLILFVWYKIRPVKKWKARKIK